MVAAKLDHSRVLVTKFHQNRSMLKGRSAGPTHTHRHANSAENKGPSGLQSGQYFNKAGVKRELLDTVKANMLWSYNEERRELPGERNNARNSARCTQARKTTHGLDRRHQVVDRTVCGRVNQNDRG